MQIRFLFFKINLIFSFLVLSNFSVFSQKGSPYITNYDLQNKNKYLSWSIVQDENKLMLFAGRNGILSFDGINWDMTVTPAMPVTMYSDTSIKRIYVGCVNDIGYLKRDTTGRYKFYSIINSSFKIGKVIEITSTDDELIVLSDKFLTIFNIHNNRIIKKIEAVKNKVLLNKIINLSGEVFLVNKYNRFYKLKNDSLYNVRIKNKSNIGKILFDFQISKTKSIVGTDNNKLYFFGGKSFWRFNIQDQKYLDESVLSDAILLSDSKIAVSTLIGGIIIIDVKTRKTVKTVNYSSGLPDNEIYAIGKDEDNALWLSHHLGISRIDFSNPVKFFDTYPGTKGRLLSVISSDNVIYVGTSEGLFYLEELDDYKRARMIEKKITVISKDIKTEKKIKAKEDKKNKGVFSGLHKKIKNFITPDNTIQLSEQKRKSLIRKRKLLGMQSLSHSFREIEGIEDRCKILLPYEDQLLVGGNNGVYLIEEGESKKVITDFYINNIIPDKSNPNLFYVCTNTGLLFLEFKDDEALITEVERLKNLPVHSVFSNDTSIWASAEENVFLINKEGINIKTWDIENKYSEQTLIQEFNNNIFIVLPSKVYYYNQSEDNFKFLLAKNLVFLKIQTDALWIYENKKWKSFLHPAKYNLSNEIYLNLFNNIEYIYIDKKNNTWVIDDKSKLYKINNRHSDFVKPEQSIFIKDITDRNDNYYSLENLSLDADENYLQVTLSAPFYIKQNGVEFKYFLEGLMKKWSGWKNDENISFPYIPSGKYKLHIKARNVLGTESDKKTLSFSIKQPFWEKDWFMIGSGFTVLLLILIIIKLRERKLRMKQKYLEEKIKERTQTIEEQKNQLAKTNQNIKESIVYAGRIQKAIMPSEELLDKSFKDYFVYFKPRDIVSGDFYWLKKIGNYTVYAVADCTGHGVPGALLSMLGISFLSEIVSKARFDTPDEILNRLRKKIKSSLKQTGKGFESKDGMDIALCVIDHDELFLQFAGAYNPVYIVREGELIEIKASRNPIAAFIKEKPFQLNEFQLQKDDLLYTFSDGYSDQFGQNENQKFNKRNLKKLLIKIADKPMSEQKEILDDVFKKWKGETDQTDDIIIMGVKI